MAAWRCGGGADGAGMRESRTLIVRASPALRPAYDVAGSLSILIHRRRNDRGRALRRPPLCAVLRAGAGVGAGGCRAGDGSRLGYRGAASAFLAPPRGALRPAAAPQAPTHLALVGRGAADGAQRVGAVEASAAGKHRAGGAPLGGALPLGIAVVAVGRAILRWHPGAGQRAQVRPLAQPARDAQGRKARTGARRRKARHAQRRWERGGGRPASRTRARARALGAGRPAWARGRSGSEQAARRARVQAPGFQLRGRPPCLWVRPRHCPPPGQGG